jgi:hypothetical protein
MAPHHTQLPHPHTHQHPLHRTLLQLLHHTPPVHRTLQSAPAQLSKFPCFECSNPAITFIFPQILHLSLSITTGPLPKQLAVLVRSISRSSSMPIRWLRTSSLQVQLRCTPSTSTSIPSPLRIEADPEQNYNESLLMLSFIVFCYKNRRK